MGTTAVSAGGKRNEVGGLPIFYSAQYVDPTTGTAVITTPAGFIPDLVMVLDNTGTNPNQYWWRKGDAAGAGTKNTGSSGILTVLSTNGITVASGSITLGTDVCDTGVTGNVFAWRFAQ